MDDIVNDTTNESSLEETETALKEKWSQRAAIFVSDYWVLVSVDNMLNIVSNVDKRYDMLANSKLSDLLTVALMLASKRLLYVLNVFITVLSLA